MGSHVLNSDLQHLEDIFAGLSKRFAEADAVVKNYQDDLAQQVKKLQSAVAKPPALPLKKDMPIVQVFEGIHQECVKTCNRWLENIDQTAKNMSLREKCNDSMLVYVYGKVKTGKSSLGNFIAYGKNDPTAKDIQHFSHVEFDVEKGRDTSNKGEEEKITKQQECTRKERRFLVDFLEATACIQYFRKPGLTWIDSPGIHSCTQANGELARKYLEAADLVLYTTSARSAMQEADRKELRSIIDSGKKFIIVVTKCDAVEEDNDESGNEIKYLIMKPDSDRREIITWSVDSVKHEIGEDNEPSRDTLQKNTITISCKFAEEHKFDDAWQKSGLPDLLQQIGDIAQGEGVNIKRKTPLLAALSHVHSMADGIDNLREEIVAAGKQLDELRDRIRRNTEQQRYKCNSAIKLKIMKFADDLYGQDATFRKAAFQVTEEQLAQAWEELASSIIADTVAMTKNMPNGLRPIELQGFEDITRTTTYKTTGKSRIGTVLGAVAGGAIGFMVAGPAGAALGAGLLSTGGSAAGSWFDDVVEKSVRVGDNRFEVGRDTAQKLQNLASEYLATMSEHMVEKCIVPVQTWLESLDSRLKEFSAQNSRMENTLEGELK